MSTVVSWTEWRCTFRNVRRWTALGFQTISTCRRIDGWPWFVRAKEGWRRINTETWPLELIPEPSRSHLDAPAAIPSPTSFDVSPHMVYVSRSFVVSRSDFIGRSKFPCVLDALVTAQGSISIYLAILHAREESSVTSEYLRLKTNPSLDNSEFFSPVFVLFVPGHQEQRVIESTLPVLRRYKSLRCFCFAIARWTCYV